MPNDKSVGPIYGVQLIDVLPLNPDKSEGMLQQMPSAEDLKRCRQRGERVCAGYEVLLHHWRARGAEIERLQKRLAKLNTAIGCDMVARDCEPTLEEAMEAARILWLGYRGGEDDYEDAKARWPWLADDFRC